MIRRIEVSLRCWHPAGHTVQPADFLNRLAAPADHFAIAGSGEAWEAARIVTAEHAAGSFADQPEPDEAFHRALQDSLIRFTRWMGSVSSSAVSDMKKEGFMVDVFVEALMDQDQMELGLPSELLAELGRLGIPLSLLTNG